MGRWDALKPDDSHNKDGARSNKTLLSRGERVQKLATFAVSNGNYSSDAIDGLARLVSSQVKELPAEETAQKVVGPIFLQALGAASCQESTQIKICDSLNKLLSNSQFASAMLAPLVQDVSIDDGKEQTVINPLRRDLFRTLQSLLFSDSKSVLLRVTVCSTLASAIQALRRTDQGLATLPSDLDEANLEQFLVMNLGHTLPLYQSSLLLLRAVLQMSSKEFPKLGARLLFPDRSKTGPRPNHLCPHCSCPVDQFSSFLNSVHDSIATDLAGLALDCTADLIEVLPLDRWLKLQPNGRSPVSGFHRKVVDSLTQIVSIARCALLQKRESGWEESLGRLCTKIFVAVPWEDERLEQGGELLWSVLVSLFQHPDTTPVSRTAIGSVMVSAMGGRVTPQGDLPPMALPISRWLSRDGYCIPLVQSILSGIHSMNKKDASSHSLDVLFCAMLRTRPETALPLWADFEKYLRDAVRRDDSKTRGSCICILEAFLLGRKDFPSKKLRSLDEAQTISELVFSILECMKEDTNAKNRGRTMNCYATLGQVDWEYLRLDDARLMLQVDTLFQFSSDSQVDVRRSACKAIGEFSSQYLTRRTLAHSSNGTITNTIVRRIYTTMSKILKEDPNASTRSMAIFALGNLAVAINEHDAMELLPASTVIDISNSIRAAMNDSNDKVVGNAIRSIGHWGSILARLDGSPDETHLSQSLLGVLDGLSDRVARAVAVASTTQRSNLSWKERSAAKKHGWGACHSLGRVLGSLAELDQSYSILEDSLSVAVEQLVLCLKHAALLSEKVVLSSMVALRSLKPLQLVGVTGKSGLIGDGLVYCCFLLFSETCNTRFVEEGGLLLSHLLCCASILDVTNVLKQEDFESSMLESLYQWMVEREMEARAFEIFALGLQRSGLATSHDVSLEQRFVSRALWQYKKEQSISLGSDDEGNDDEL